MSTSAKDPAATWDPAGDAVTMNRGGGATS